jgi:hypothetical protein
MDAAGQSRWAHGDATAACSPFPATCVINELLGASLSETSESPRSNTNTGAAIERRIGLPIFQKNFQKLCDHGFRNKYLKTATSVIDKASGHPAVNYRWFESGQGSQISKAKQQFIATVNSTTKINLVWGYAWGYR